MSIKKIVVLINSMANSSRMNHEEIKKACEHINRFKPCELVYTKGIEDFLEKIGKISSGSGELLAVSGGDGTLNLALNKISHDAPISIIPTGTANVVAKELGIPFKLRDAFKLMLSGALQKMDLGLCNGKKFAFVAGIGFDAAVANSVSKRLKSCFGQFAYGIAAIKTFFNYKPTRLVVECDNGEKLEGEFAIFANMRRYGGELYFAPEARYNDGLINLVLLKKFTFNSLLKLIKFAYKKEICPENIAVRFCGRNFKVTSSEPVLYELDGEVMGLEKEFEIGVEPSALKVITI